LHLSLRFVAIHPTADEEVGGIVLGASLAIVPWVGAIDWSPWVYDGIVRNISNFASTRPKVEFRSYWLARVVCCYRDIDAYMN
jgi:hypothetical protein